MFCHGNEDNSHLHGCNVSCELVCPWGCSDRVVVADSCFASVPAAVRLFKEGSRFIGALKTSTKECPMDWLSRVELPAGKGDRQALTAVDLESGARSLAFVWCDRDRRHFISTCSNTQDGSMIDRHRWRQVDWTSNAPASRVNVTVRQPRACQICCSGCSKIDQHNRSRQAGLMIEKKLKVQTLDKRINITLFAMMCVDSHKLFAGMRKPVVVKERDCCERLSQLLIDNCCDSRDLQDRKKRSTNAEILLQDRDIDLAHAHSIPSSRQLIGVAPTKRHKKGHPKHLLQGCYRVCDSLATTVCRACQLELGLLASNQCWICNKPGKVCMGSHIIAHHPDMIATNENKAVAWNRAI